MVKLAIDPGHGLNNLAPGVYDSGAYGNSFEEAACVLKVGLTVKFFAADYGIPYLLLRKGDGDGLSLSRRPVAANTAECSHYVALHLNSAGSHISGTETYYRSVKDKAWADVVQRAALRAFGLKDRGVKPESDSQYKKLAVFAATGACALCEMGFITNEEDMKSVMNRENRLEFAQTIMIYLESLSG